MAGFHCDQSRQLPHLLVGDEPWRRLRTTSPLTFLSYRNIVSLSRPMQGTSHERHKTRGGMRWPLRGARRASRSGGPSCDDPGPVPGLTSGGYQVGRPCQGVAPPGLSQSKPQTPRAERRRNRRSVVTSAHALLTFAHEAMGLAESPAFRAPLRRACRACPICAGISEGKECGLEYGRARAGQRTGTAELCPCFANRASCLYPPPCGRVDRLSVVKEIGVGWGDAWILRCCPHPGSQGGGWKKARPSRGERPISNQPRLGRFNPCCFAQSMASS